MGVPTKRPVLAYPETDDMGEHELQRLITELLRPLLARLLAERGVVAHAGADQFIYWAKGVPTRRAAPDIYVLPGVAQEAVIRSWLTWETGIVPSFVLEVASDDITKDYDDNPALYADLGVDELIVFDPHARPGSRSRRVRWQVYRRLAKRGLVRVDVSQSDRVRSKVLRTWLRAIGEGDAVRLRLGVGPHGDELYATEAEQERAAKERAEAAKERAEAAKAQAEAAKAQAEAAQARAEAAEARARAEILRLRSLLQSAGKTRPAARRRRS